MGDWVEVIGDYSPGTCSEGGMGSIKRVHRGCEGQEQNADVTLYECSHVDVRYVLTGNVEKMVPLTRLTAVPFAWKVPTFKLNCIASGVVNAASLKGTNVNPKPSPQR